MESVHFALNMGRGKYNNQSLVAIRSGAHRRWLDALLDIVALKGYRRLIRHNSSTEIKAIVYLLVREKGH